MAPKAATELKRESRAVTRLIEAGSMAECSVCEKVLKFRARQRDFQVICNVYEDGNWVRVEHFHDECYVEADEPFGPPAEMTPRRRG